ncbi:MAG: DNA repair protein RadC [Prevotellaceae bacterium]|jgi:DNA repair protein RadC|nr:DNA repair protein RadC [Prevotellaceae bacterium]
MLPIKSWAEEDRPREKMLQKGIAALSDAELLAILIATGTQNETAVELAKRVLALTDNNLNSLGKLSVKDLQQLKGIGEAKAIGIVAALELGRRRKQSETPERISLQCSHDIASYFTPMLTDLPHEEFWVLMLNTRLKIIGAQKVAQGGVDNTSVDMRMLLKPCIEKLASVIAVAHNHPSGNAKPSAHDNDITKRIKEAAALINIQLADHIIIAGSRYFSYADEGLL